jgi:protein SCO1/2
MHGTSFDFRKETDGGVTLLFFGYTHCPDICPNHMHNLAAVLRKMSEADARRVHVVFVTVDPQRDTGERLREWLGAIHPQIVGVRPTVEEANRIQSSLHIQPALLYEPRAGHEGSYDVGHAAPVIAFTPDNMGRFAYAAGTRQADWAHDIPLLLKARWKTKGHE